MASLPDFFDNYELERCLKAVVTDRKYLSDDIVSSVFDIYRKQKAENAFKNRNIV